MQSIRPAAHSSCPLPSSRSNRRLFPSTLRRRLLAAYASPRNLHRPTHPDSDPAPAPAPPLPGNYSHPSTSGRDQSAQNLRHHHIPVRLRYATARPPTGGLPRGAASLQRAAAAARSTLAAALAASSILTAPLVGSGASAWAAPAEAPAPAAATTATAAAVLAAADARPAGSLPAPPLLAASLPAAVTTLALASDTPASAPAPAAFSVPAAPRFTGPEALDALPPLPTEFPPLPELKLPKYTTATLRNGLRVFLLVDDEVPLVRATLLMRGGQYASPPDKVGLASATAYVQRAGGSADHPAAVLDSRLEALAASIEMGAGPQALSADLGCLAEDAEEVMGLMAEVVRSPALPTDKLALFQAQVLNSLEHQNDSPGSVGRRKITKLLYGPDSIYARTPTKAGVSSITPEDLRSFAQRWERPDGAVLGVVGRFRPAEMLAVVEREFGAWAPAAGQPAAPPAVPRGAPPALPPLVEAAAAPGANGVSAGTEREEARVRGGPAAPRRPVVYLVDRPGLTQANVLTAEPGVTLSDPDVFALDVLGGVFNSFGGQLFDTLRSREGLAYSVSGSWDSPPDHQGLFLAGGQTSAPGEFLRSLRALLARAAAEPPAEAQLAAAKAETLNSFAFNFASSASQLQRILVYDLLGLPQDYLFQYFRGIEQVGQPDVARAAAAHLRPERQAVVVVGDREVAQPSLEAAGFEVLPMRLEDGPGVGA